MMRKWIFDGVRKAMASVAKYMTWKAHRSVDETSKFFD
jgi:hypothetical protein